jgi:hypothetical protein
MTPIRRGTARRLGLRQPTRWYYIRRRGYIDACCRAGAETYPQACPWHPR